MKILSIDGGGIKGVFAASFLAEIEQVCKVHMCEYFDLIAGTSTGGIIAAALATKIPAERIMNLYLNKAKEIFPKRWNYLRLLFNPKYEKEPLRKALDEVFGDKKIRDCETRLLIPTCNLVNQKTRVFKTPHAEDLYIDKDIRLADCLLSTTAAPTYFQPHIMDDGSYIDGGIGANNPTLIAVIEGMTRCNWKKEEISVLSIGGVDEIRALSTGRENMSLHDVKKIVKCYMNAECQYSDNISKLLLGRDRILRVNHQDTTGEVKLDNADKKSLKLLQSWGKSEAQNYIHQVKRDFLGKQRDAITFYNLDEQEPQRTF